MLSHFEPTLGRGFGASARAALAPIGLVAVGTPVHLVVSIDGFAVVVVTGAGGGARGNGRHSPGLTRTSSIASDVWYVLPRVYKYTIDSFSYVRCFLALMVIWKYCQSVGGSNYLKTKESVLEQ